MRLTIILFILLITLSVIAQTGNIWIKKSSFGGDKRERCVSFSIGNKGYFATGQDTSDTVKNDLWEYDPVTDSWTQKANLSGSVRRNAISFTIDNYAYVGLGADSAIAPNGNILSDMWKYSPVTNSWVQLSDYPGGNGLGIYFATAFSINGKGYVCCGKKGPNDYTDQLWEYKPYNDQWVIREPFPGGVRYQLTSFTVNNKAYIGLGTDNEAYRKDMWEYDPAKDTWLQKSDFPGYERAGVSAFFINDKGYICLGADGGFKDDLWEYNFTTDSWTLRDNYPGDGRKYAGSFVIDNKAYVGTGKGYSGLRRSFYVYIPYEALLVEDLSNDIQFNVFPNPLIDKSVIILGNGASKIKKISLYNINGIKVWGTNINNSENIILKNEFSQGVYQLIAYGDDIVWIKKIIIL